MTVVRTRSCSSTSATTQAFVRGDYDLALGVFPEDGLGSGTNGSIRAGDKWYGTGATTTIGGIEFSEGVTFEAKVSNPGQTLANWRVYY